MADTTPDRESGIGILLPEADAVLAPWREQYDPSAAYGVGAHVTLLYPFKHPDRIDDALLDQLAAFFRERPAFTLELAGICAFPNALYLVPEPQDVLERLVQALATLYPDTPPYGGAYTDVIPHVTVAQPADIALLEPITQAFCREAASRLPIRADVREATLFVQESDGMYRTRATFPFGPPS
jgi:2'-5' RNA ligase